MDGGWAGSPAVRGEDHELSRRLVAAIGAAVVTVPGPPGSRAMDQHGGGSGSDHYQRGEAGMGAATHQDDPGCDAAGGAQGCDEDAPRSADRAPLSRPHGATCPTGR